LAPRAHHQVALDAAQERISAVQRCKFAALLPQSHRASFGANILVADEEIVLYRSLV